MSRRVEFRVDALPPKKDGASSMWAKSAEVPRLVELRRAACAAMAGQAPFRRAITLGLEIHVPSAVLGSVGDLDNFVTGVCDGLMAASRGVRSHDRWLAEDVAAFAPALCVAIVDDSQVVRIDASKSGDAASPWYRVVLEGE